VIPSLAFDHAVIASFRVALLGCWVTAGAAAVIAEWRLSRLPKTIATALAAFLLVAVPFGLPLSIAFTEILATMQTRGY